MPDAVMLLGSIGSAGRNVPAFRHSAPVSKVHKNLYKADWITATIDIYSPLTKKAPVLSKTIKPTVVSTSIFQPGLQAKGKLLKAKILNPADIKCHLSD